MRMQEVRGEQNFNGVSAHMTPIRKPTRVNVNIDSEQMAEQTINKWARLFVRRENIENT